MVRSEALKKAQKTYYTKLKNDTLRYDEFKRNNREKLKEKKDKIVSENKKNKETVQILTEENEKLQNQLEQALKELSLKNNN
tara:strand:- start:996 stop:1241 length:246 start_codon:yes stop_codon:yes gene_type:complete